MAYAVPGKTGVCIHIFYQRVAAATTPRLTPVLLAHVLAHEITHVLEGVARHSEDGVMKAHWNSRDYQQMSDHPLPFAEEDVQLVRSQLAKAQRATAIKTRVGTADSSGLDYSASSKAHSDPGTACW